MKNGKQDFNNINFNEEMTVNGFLDAISEMEYPQYLLGAISAVQDWLRKLIVNIEEDEADDEDEENSENVEAAADEELKTESEAKSNSNPKSKSEIRPEFKYKAEDNDDDKSEAEMSEMSENSEDDDKNNDVEDFDFDGTVDFLKKMFESEEIEEMDVEDSLAELFERIDSIDEKVDVIPNTHKPEGNRDAVIISVLAPDCEGGLRTAIDYAAVFNRKKSKRVWIISDAFVFDNAAHFAGHINALEKQGISIRFILVNPWGWIELPLSRSSALRKQFTWRATASHCDKSGDKLNDLTGD